MTSIIIVSYNTKDILADCLKSIFSNLQENFEVIVVDNDSKDGSPALIEKKFPQVKLIKAGENLGFGRANNLGAEQAEGDLLFFLNSDTILSSNILLTAKACFKENSQLGLLAPQLLLSSGEPQAFAFGRFPSLKNLIFRRVSLKLNFEKKIEVDWISGAAFFIPKKIWQQVKGFDPNFFMYFEDVDLCWRVKKAGYLVITNPKMSLVHLGGKSLGDKNWSRKNYYYVSQDYFYTKHYGRGWAWLLKIVRQIFLIFNNYR